jgi:light-regulated signal transduction histidine kinase (bacteriophytochrome)
VKDKGLVIETDVKGQEFELYSDKKRIKQVLLNLVSNAIKFTDEGAITIKVCFENSLRDAMSTFKIATTDTTNNNINSVNYSKLQALNREMFDDTHMSLQK